MENKELGRLILKQAEAFPETFDMNTWGYKADCGTVACIAGHAMLFSGYTQSLSTYYRPDGSAVADNATEARDLLGLSYEEFRPGDQVCLFNGSQPRKTALARLEALCEED